MKKFIFLLAALFICHAASAGTLKSETIQDQGVTRSYYIYLPADLPANAPLVQLPTHFQIQVGMFTILGRLTR